MNPISHSPDFILHLLCVSHLEQALGLGTLRPGYMASGQPDRVGLCEPLHLWPETQPGSQQPHVYWRGLLEEVQCPPVISSPTLEEALQAHVPWLPWPAHLSLLPTQPAKWSLCYRVTDNLHIPLLLCRIAFYIVILFPLQFLT